ncbi:Predicted ATPase [Pustulibacterium marinum]|uniref:Predicted ATPase n=1 Tax=Pustulibacterium marinum TaxID=1224947 RepID=A0A1I7HZR2_9FLAO|nr:ATP-binding protein [Pustulibacterium marinum]SFU66185.1 Predicted ATPase [Pustulibacterium marinum]
MKPKKIVITGGPGSGKTSIIDELLKRKFHCLPEISREVILEARKKGIEQLFLTHPLLFSEKLLQGRVEQYNQTLQLDETMVFLDRGIHDVLAYMDFIGDEYPESFVDSCKNHVYDTVFILPPWKDIYISDNERYENYDQALKIHENLKKTYESYGYELMEVPTGTVEERTDFIINVINYL